MDTRLNFKLKDLYTVTAPRMIVTYSDISASHGG
jgi:hypothetical protein